MIYVTMLAPPPKLVAHLLPIPCTDTSHCEQTQGGGNCANALTAAARLGLSPYIVSKIGDDGIGDGIIAELNGDGVNTDYLIRAQGHPSPFTYIIVDREGMTPVHSPWLPLHASLTPQRRISG